MAGTRRDVPNDPDRKRRILDAALAVIAAEGVHGTTQRKIAERAGVPLGSVTYYFDGVDDLITQAFALLAEGMSETYRTLLSSASGRDDAERAVVDLICGPEYATAEEMTVIFEMYAYANHHPRVAAITGDWVERSRASLALHFTAPAAAALDVLVEGWPMHRVFSGRALDRVLVERTVRAIVDALEPRPAS